MKRLPEDQILIRKTNLLVRMPVKIEPSANGIVTRKPLVKTNAAAGRQNRFRKQDGPITWVRPTARSLHGFRWSLVPEYQNNNNIGLGFDQTRSGGKYRHSVSARSYTGCYARGYS